LNEIIRPSSDAPDPALAQRARRLQAEYAASRREWAQAVGRPYDGDPDLRPPPGELDAAAEE
jgi:hypothetical protein